MLHTKFRGIQSADSEEEDSLRVFTIYVHGGDLGHVTSIILIYPCSGFKLTACAVHCLFK